ncbi:MAG: response regulator [Pirellulales bacterium]
MFHNEFQVETVRSGTECIEACAQAAPNIILLGVNLPDTSDIDVCQKLRESIKLENTQILIIGEQCNQATRLAGFAAGADDFISKCVSPEELIAKVRVLSKLHKAVNRAQAAEEKLQHYNSELERVADTRAEAVQSTQDIAVFALAKLADYRDNETGEHLVRMRAYAQILGEHLSQHGPYTHQIDSQFLDDLYRSSPLHDIGKVGIADSILNKPGKLTEDEFEIMKTHAVIGAETLEETANLSPSGSFIHMAASIARHHHERWNGKGYPDGLSGLDIPLAARIVAVADVYDALTSKRVYKRSFSHEESREIIEEEYGQHFEPAMIDAFRNCLDKFQEISQGIVGPEKINSKRISKSPRYRVGIERGTVLQKNHEKVLVIDDDPSILRILSKWLTDEGYDVSTADNGEDALKLIEETLPRFVLTDWNMDGLNGESICRWIREQHLAHYIYTIVITADDQEDTVLKAFHSGADDLLPKPLKRDSLIARLKSASRVVELENQLHSQTRNDPLTGLATKRYLEEQLQREWHCAVHYRSVLSCVLLDIDSFREINEREGIASGDQIVKKIAKILIDSTRVTDYVCRLDSDRFLIVQTESNENQTTDFAERLRQIICEKVFEVGGRPVHLTVSLGIAQSKSEVQDLDQLIESAEESLVVAKRLKGNRVIAKGFLSQSETEELSKAIGRNPLATMMAKDIMSSPIEYLSETDSAQHASQFLLQHSINSAPVVNSEGQLVGILSEKYLLKCLVYGNRWNQPISTKTTKNIVSFEENESAEVIYNFLLKAAIRRVIIVKDGRPSGVISRGSLLRWINTEGHASDPSSLLDEGHQVGLIESLEEIINCMDSSSISLEPADN